MRYLLLLLPLATLACNGSEDSDVDEDTSDVDTDPGTQVADPGDLAFYSYDNASCGSSSTTIRGTTGSEDGHWSAAKITPGQAFSVNEVRLHLFNDPEFGDLDCDGNLATTVQVWVTTEDTPPTNAEADLTLDVPQAEITDNERVLRLAADFDVGPDDNVFIAIQMTATAAAATCVRTCDDAVGSDDNYWSNAQAAPFDWQSFSSFNLQTTQFMSLHGE